MWLAKDPDEGRSVKALLGELDIPELELRETLRKLDAAGLVRREKAAGTRTRSRTPRQPTLKQALDFLSGAWNG